MSRETKGPHPAHVIVLGNEKGGSGKSTTAMHIVVALLKAGARVASIDTDGRQRSLTRYIENRAYWRERTGVDLELPTHFTVPHGEGELVADIEEREFRAFAEAISRAEFGYDFVVVDTAGSQHLSDARQPRDGRHAGHADQRQLHRLRRARPGRRRHAGSDRAQPLRRAGLRIQAAAPDGRRAHDGLGGGAQPAQSRWRPATAARSRRGSSSCPRGSASAWRPAFPSAWCSGSCSRAA